MEGHQEAPGRLGAILNALDGSARPDYPFGGAHIAPPPPAFGVGELEVSGGRGWVK